MESYETITDEAAGSIPAWNGQCVSSDGCACSSHYNLSAYNQTLPSSETLTYEPSEIIEFKNPQNTVGNAFKSALRRGGVVMSPYSVNRITTTNHIVGVRYISNIYGRLQTRVGTRKADGINCSYYCHSKAAPVAYNKYTLNGDYNAWITRGFPVITVSAISPSDLLEAQISSREAATLKSVSDYDALTELVELPKSLELFKDGYSSAKTLFTKFLSGHSMFDLKAGARLTPRSLLRSASRSLRKVGSSWLSYRYGIMPIVYSVKAIDKLWNDGFRTIDKASRSVLPTSYSPTLPSFYIRKETTGSVLVRSTVASAYRSAELSQLGRISINPLVTLYEEIPYSFMADWFVNMGDYILANFSTSLAAEVACCQSTKTALTDTYTLVLDQNQSLTKTWSLPSPTNSCWLNAGMLPAPTVVTNQQSEWGVLRTVKTETYSRSVFARGGAVNLRLNPSISWRRAVDTAAITHSNFKRIVKGLTNLYFETPLRKGRR